MALMTKNSGSQKHDLFDKAILSAAMYYSKVTYKQVALKRRLCVGHRRGVITCQWGVPHGGHRAIASQVFIRHRGRKSKLNYI